jgi:hypothetical protein
MLDTKQMLTYLRKRAEHDNVIVHSVLMGLVTRIERGDFDTEEES